MRTRRESSTFLTRAGMRLNTLNDIFFSIAGRDQPDLMLRLVGDRWQPISSQQFVAKVSGVVATLRSWGISRGDRVAIVGENRHEWVVADFACFLLGAVVVPIYTTLTADQTAYMLQDSGARVIFVSTDRLLEKVLSALSSTFVEKVVVMDDVSDARAVRMSELMDTTAEADVGAAGRDVQASDLATIIYTSGTTGIPKGVMSTHGNMTANIRAFAGLGFALGMPCVSFLPLSHVTARAVDLGLLNRGVTLAHLPQLEKLPQALLEVRPDILLGVPRVYEKIHAQTELQDSRFPE